MKRISRLVALVVLLSCTWAQTTGKISGKVTAEDGTALSGADISVLGMGSGAAANENGEFLILNVLAGSYTVKASYIGYSSLEVSNVRVMSGLNTEVNLVLSVSALQGEVVQVTAEKALIQKDETSSVSVVTSEQLENMPIRSLDGILATMPGVVVQNNNVHIRGGRDNEVAYFLNGASTTNLGNRENLVYVPQEAIEELQVQVGGYDAEVSGANSGVVKRSLKRGTSEFTGTFSHQFDGGDAGDEFLGGYSYGHATTLASVSGPLLGESLKFFAAFEKSNEEDPYVKVSKAFAFENQKDENPSATTYGSDEFGLSWKDGITPGSSDEFTNITGTLNYDAGPLRASAGLVQNSKINNYGGGIMSQLRWGGTTIMTADSANVTIDPRYAYNESASTMLTSEITYALGARTILRANMSSYSQTSETKDSWFGNSWMDWHDSSKVQDKLGIADDSTGWTPFKSYYSEKSSYQVNGMSFSRPGTRPSDYYKSSYAKTGLSASLQHVMGNHDFKVGFDYNKHTLRDFRADPNVMKFSLDNAKAIKQYGHVGFGSFDAIPDNYKRTEIDGYGYDFSGKEIDSEYSWVDPDDANNVILLDGAKTPTELGFYLQDKMEFDDIIVNIGIRIDQLDPSEKTLERPDSIMFYETSGYIRPESWTEVEPYTEIQPRIGVSFPFTDRTNVYGYYGRFSQLVDLNSMYYTANDYRTQINSGGNYYSDPVGFGLEPVRTTQYEIGFKQQIADNAALKVTGFYKNQKGLIQADRVDAYYGDLDGAYNYVKNGDFATTKGLELSLSMRRYNGLAVNMNYTLSQAEGTGSGRSSYLAALDRQSTPPLMVNPVDFNQSHSGAVNLDYRVSGTSSLLDGLGSNMLFTFNSGHNFTYVYRPVGGQVSAFDAGVDYMNDTRSRQALEPIGASQTPWVYNLDLKLDKRFTFGNYGVTVFARINNLFDRRNALNVYQASGSADDDGFISSEVYSQAFIDLYGDDDDGDGVTDYEEMYRAINIDNDESYRTSVGGSLISAPRQAFLGFSFDF